MPAVIYARDGRAATGMLSQWRCKKNVVSRDELSLDVSVKKIKLV